MCLARPAGRQPALARRSGHGVSPPRPVRSVWLPQRPYPGFVSLPPASFKFDRPEGGRQPEWESPGLLAQPGFAAGGRATGCSCAHGRRSKPDNEPPALTDIQLRRLRRSNANSDLLCLEFAMRWRYLFDRRSQGNLIALRPTSSLGDRFGPVCLSPRVVGSRCAPWLPCSRL